jgi:hypothetical protein
MMATLAHEILLLAGSKFSSSGKAKLVSGSGRLFSRDLIEEFLKTHKTFPAWRIDDVAISLHAQVLHANFRYWDRFDITCEADLQKFKEECLEHQDIFHFRIKTHERPKLDAEIMMNLHDFFQK